MGPSRPLALDTGLMISAQSQTVVNQGGKDIRSISSSTDMRAGGCTGYRSMHNMAGSMS